MKIIKLVTYVFLVFFFIFIKKIMADNTKKTTEQFIKNAIKIHGQNFIYNNVQYINNHTKVEITCPLHGEFLQTPKNHLNGFGCSICSGNEKLSNNSFIKRAIEKHGNKYDYSKTVYKNAFTKLIIICPAHGEFETTARNHYYKGYGCKKCGYSDPHNKLTLSEFSQRAELIHGQKYDYSKVNYQASNKNVIIICPEHGEFKQMPASHLQGCGCKRCSSSVGEKLINKILLDNKIDFSPQHKFDDCRNPLTNRKLEFDFYLPGLNMCLEYDGLQHFEPVKYWGGNKNLEKIKIRDKIKQEYCLKNNISLIRISYKQNIQEELNKLLN